MEGFQAAVLPVIVQYDNSAVKIVEAFNCETDSTRKKLLEVAGLFCAYLQLKNTVPGAEELGKQATIKWAEMNA